MNLTLFQDKKFYQTMFKLGTPIVIQNLITFSLGAVDMLMIGQLGATEVAAVGLADQVFFLLILMLFGISSGAAVFSAQYWGKEDMSGIHRVLGLSLLISLAGGLFFAAAAVLVPERILGIYTQDPAVIALGSSYLRIVGFSYVGTAVAVCYTFILRSIESVRLPMIVGGIALVFNTSLNYVLIFGHFGMPRLEVAGAAIATCGARFLEPIILLLVIYLTKSPLAASLRQLLAFDLGFVPKFLKTSLPVVMTEVAWSLGITTYSIIYARISTEAIAAINIVVTIERMAFIIFLAMASASAIMIGNRIGADEIDKAYDYGKRFMVLGALVGLPVGWLVIAAAGPIMSLYNVAPVVVEAAQQVMTVMGLILPIKITALMIFIGVLRSGGDTRFSFFLDAGAIWLIGVPLAFTGAFIWGLPIYWVYLLSVTEEVIKVGLALWRFFYGPWIHQLAEPQAVPEPEAIPASA